uniref:NADH-ubiquinone oxidoreductase chain 4 n=1 Tax=Phloeotribus sp. BMNH 1047247 TaxID=1903799 RepID=A0A343A5H8_9CUCU|nr:NADH dehydrogenase subunit 4 [Phloeotribus sp. BMNH 1047247]
MMMLMMSLMLIPLILNYWLILFYMLVFMFFYMMKVNLLKFYSDLSYFLALDTLSFSMIMLTIWICLLMVLASGKLYNNNFYWKLYMLMIFILFISLLLTFFSLNLFLFYLFFEVSLIPTFLLIMGWGVQPERILAGVYLLFYTLLVSLPMMIIMFFLYKNVGTLEMYYLMDSENFIIYLFVSMFFFVKIPMFLVHLWLPKAHVEAPVSGSMILAGVLLKLGGYGLFRLMKLMMYMGMKFNFIFISISMIGSIYISLMCLRQSDMKSLIAYSSVSHMGLVLSSILTMNLIGSWGSLLMMLAHGLSSSGLFCLANLSYERTHSRSLFMNKGLLNILPNLSLWWFLLIVSSMSAPFSMNFFSEILLFNSMFIYSKVHLILLFILSFFSAVYSMFLYSFTQHGKMFSSIYSFCSVSFREYLLMFLHWVPLNIMFLKMEIFM